MAKNTATIRIPLIFCAAILVCADAPGQSRSDLVDAMDLFAVAHLDKVQELSIRDDVEYCGYFGFDAAGKIAATPARKGGRDGCLADEPPSDFDISASYHTHGSYARDADTEVPSIDDLLGDFEEGIDGYIATPAGRVWLNLLDEELSIQLCGPGCVTADPDFKRCPAFLPGVEYRIKDLRARVAADTGDC